MPKHVFEVIVGNVGTVHTGNDYATARKEYCIYVDVSKAGVGRAAGESVYLMKDGEPVMAHQGPADDEVDG